MTAPAARPGAVASIPMGVPFLRTLASWWLGPASGEAGAADALFLVPTRRAARALTEAFLAETEGAPLLLPRIVAIGAVDEVPLALAGALDLPPAIEPKRRLALLARQILALNGAGGAPRTAERAWALAEALADLLDEAARADVDLAAALPGLVADEFATHWAITLDFLRIVTEHWPAVLAAEGAMDPAARQIALLRAQAAQWRAAPPAHPVIAAGTTGAIPAVAELLQVVAALPGGRVVLPGLDRTLADEAWAKLGPTHPQASLKSLIAALGVARAEVVELGGPDRARDRAALLSRALLPGETLHLWQESGSPPVAGLSLLRPADQQEEAAAAALILRAALETPGATAALITPDRALAQRVSAELLRFGVVADDSAGEALAETPPAVFLRLLATAWAEALAPVPLLSLLKHPLAQAGLPPGQCREAARALERAALRGPRPSPGLAGLRRTKADPAFLDRLAACLAPLEALPGRAPPDAQLRALIEAAEALGASEDMSGAHLLWREEEGEALADALTGLLAAWAHLPPQTCEELPGLLLAGLAGTAIRTRRALRGRAAAGDAAMEEHPRLFIWGLLEARLQSADTVVLGGLTEGVWPGIAESGPWMNRAMRARCGLPDPETRIGQDAHDFIGAACAAPSCVLSVPRRRERAPAVPARFVTRLEAMCGGADALPAHPAALWARALDRPAGPPTPILPPAPRPPVAARPRRLSVTEVETWLRDPFAVHARHVLRLRPLDPIEQPAEAKQFGTIVHRGLHLFYAIPRRIWPANAAAEIRACLEQALAEQDVRPALGAWWRPRLARIADWVAGEETARRAALPNPIQIAAEQPGALVFGAPAGPFTLTGRADRIDRLADGTLAILDYKTGTVPKGTEIETGHAGQLLMEAAIAEAGGFGEALRARVSELSYWRLSGGRDPGRSTRLHKKDPAATAAAGTEAALRVQALVTAFDHPDKAYLSQPHPGAAPRFSDYAQLARVWEWTGLDTEA